MAPKMCKRPAAALSYETAAEAVANGVEPFTKKHKDDSDVEAMCYWHAHEILSLKIVCIFVASGSCSAMWLQPLYSLCHVFEWQQKKLAAASKVSGHLEEVLGQVKGFMRA